MKVTIIKAVGIADLWFQAVYSVLDNGETFVIDRGSNKGQTRLEFDYFMGHITNPDEAEIFPVMPEGCGLDSPVDPAYVYGGEGYSRSYVEYLMTSIKEPGEQYTYGSRLERQIDILINTYKKFGPRNNQMVLQVAGPSDIDLSDPPCLRHIDTRIQDGELRFFIYFRSWDLWGGLPANLAAILDLARHIANELNVAVGPWIVESKGLHLYGYAEKLAKMRCFKEV